MPRPRISTWWRISSGARPTARPPSRRELDDVVRDEAVAPRDQLERGLALADAARPAQEHARRRAPPPASPWSRRRSGAGSASRAGVRTSRPPPRSRGSTSSRVSASSSALRKAASRKKREMRASAFRCMPPECSGTTSRKKRWVGWPSIESKSTPRAAAREGGQQPLEARAACRAGSRRRRRCPVLWRLSRSTSTWSRRAGSMPGSARGERPRELAAAPRACPPTPCRAGRRPSRGCP